MTMIKSCQICLEEFDLEIKIPMVLNCGHSYCQPCIKGFKSKFCPVDRKPFVQYNKNYAMLDMLSTQQTQYVESKKKINDFQALFKISFLGESTVGKSSTIKRLSNNEFEECISPTIGIDFKYITTQKDGKFYKMQLWDTAGQQRFRTLIKTHYKNSDLIVIQYALDNIQSFKQVDFWINQAAKQSPNCIIFLVGNKEDKIQTISQQSIQLLIDTHNVNHLKISCKTGSGISILKKSIANLLIQQYSKNLQKKPVKNQKILSSIIEAPKKKRCWC